MFAISSLSFTVYIVHDDYEVIKMTKLSTFIIEELYLLGPGHTQLTIWTQSTLFY